MNLLLKKLLAAVRALRGTKKRALWEAFVAGGVVGFILCIGNIASELNAKREALKDLVPEHKIVREISSSNDTTEVEAIQEESLKLNTLVTIIRNNRDLSFPEIDSIVQERSDGISRINIWYAKVVGNRAGPTGTLNSVLPALSIHHLNFSQPFEQISYSNLQTTVLSNRKTRSVL